MRLLLDTHVLVWALAAPERLSVRGRALIGDPENEIFVSVVSLWEIGIKRATGRAGAPPIPASTSHELALQAGYQILTVSAQHAIHVENLEQFHGDPFDRLLVAQALSEPAFLLTHDRILAAYSDTMILV